MQTTQNLLLLSSEDLSVSFSVLSSQEATQWVAILAALLYLSHNEIDYLHF